MRERREGKAMEERKAPPPFACAPSFGCGRRHGWPLRSFGDVVKRGKECPSQRDGLDPPMPPLHVNRPIHDLSSPCMSRPCMQSTT